MTQDYVNAQSVVKNIYPEVLRIDEYKRAKYILNKARHPVWIGYNMFERCAGSGTALMFKYENIDIGVSIMNARSGCLNVLAIRKEYQSKKIGSFILNYLKPNFASVIDMSVKFFEKNGYVKIGRPVKGIKYKTWFMMRSDLIGFHGRLEKLKNGSIKEKNKDR